MELRTHFYFGDQLTLRVKWNSRDGEEHETCIRIHSNPNTDPVDLRVEVNGVLAAIHDRTEKTLFVREGER